MGVTPLVRRLPAVLVTAVAGYYALWGGEYSAFDLRRLRRDIGTAEERLVRTRVEGDTLQVQAERLERDPATIERVARERFGMIRDGELLFRFVAVPRDDTEATRLARRP
jgi:cell division protein FtsB